MSAKGSQGRLGIPTTRGNKKTRAADLGEAT